ncbi:MAG TPA: hypothetical protein VN619_00290 [Lacisediminihabitans sp.]|nr:hypothetical protein [Lacisediminihabitans sp.]HXD60340.1 hypothetical protein [Lacisediminihabitans sp.]
MRFSSRRSPDRGGVPSGTRLPLRLGIAGAVALSAVLLSGCVQPAPVKTPQAHATVKPLFASDADALAAATKAYAAYLKVADNLLNSETSDPADIRKVATGDQLKADLAAITSLRNDGLHGTGSTTFDEVQLQQYSPQEDEGAVVIYVCEDVAATDLLNASGVSVVAPNRATRTMYEVTFDALKKERELLVANKEKWGGTC